MISFTDLSVADHCRSAQGRVHFIMTASRRTTRCGSQRCPHKGEKFPQSFLRDSTEITFCNVGFTAIMEMMREGSHGFPAPMWRVVMAINRPINGLAFPVEAVSPLELQREPHIHKAAIGQDDAQCVETRAKRLDHDGSELDLGDCAQPLDIHQAHTTASSSCTSRSR